MITITITNTITRAIARAIIPISPRPNVHSYSHNQGEEGSKFRREILVGDLLSPSSNSLIFLRNAGLPLSTPWPWGIVRSCHCGRAKDNVRTMISMADMIRPRYAARNLPHTNAICRPPNTVHHTPPASRIRVHDDRNWRLPLPAAVVGKSVSHHHSDSAWQRTELQQVYGDTGVTMRWTGRRPQTEIQG